MVKKNVLTPVLAGVLGLSIVGSGVGYFVLNKDGKTADKTKNSTTTVSPKLSVMAENISNTIDRAQDIASGDVDYAYEGSFNVSFGTAMTKNMTSVPEDLGMNVSSRQKAGNEGGDITLTYGGETLMTINEVLTRENGDEMFIKVPELSDAYLKVNKADAEQYIKDEAGMDLSQYEQTAQDIDFDAEAFEADIKEYEQVVKDNFPEVKEEGTKSGDIDGISYEYTSKTYELTNADADKITRAVLDKLKTDEQIKKLYDQGVEQVLTQQMNTMDSTENTPPTYEEAVDSMIESIDGEFDTEDDSKVTLETYENADGEFTGFTLTPDSEEGVLRYVVVSNEDAEGIDMYFDAGDGTEMTAFGALKSDDGAVNGTYTITSTEDGAETMKIVYDVKDMKNVGDNFAGTMRIDINNNQDGASESGWFEIVSASTEDNVDIKFNFGIDGEDALTLTMKSSKTEASDVELPASDATVYNALDEEELNQYLENCDLEGFQNSIKDKMGEDMYNEFFGGTVGGYDDYDYDYDDSEFEFNDDDFDWEQFDMEEPETEETDRPA